MSIRVLIADDHPETRKAVRDLLQTHAGWEICAEAADGLEAVDKTISLRPDLVILDFSMPRMNGLQAARTIHTAAPGIPLILFSIHGAEAHMISEFQSAGFRGVVPKSTAWLLPEAIESLLQGRTFFPSQRSVAPAPRAAATPVPAEGPLGDPQPVEVIASSPVPAADSAPQAISASASEASSEPSPAPVSDPEPGGPAIGSPAMS